MERQQIETAVLSVLTAVLKSDTNTGSSRQNTSQWDSLKHIEIIFAVEDELNIQFSEAELPELDSVQKIVDMVLIRNAA